MRAIKLDRVTYAVFDLQTRFIQLVELDALRARLQALQDEMEARRQEIVVLKGAIAAAKTPDTVDDIVSMDWLRAVALDGAEISRRVDEIAHEYRLAKEMWAAIENALPVGEAAP